MSKWKTKQYEIKLRVSQKEIEELIESLSFRCLSIINKLEKAFHKEVIRQEKEKDIKNRVK